MAVEALYYGKTSVRASKFGEFPIFEYEEKIPIFYNSLSFYNWFLSQPINRNEENDLKSLYNHYFSNQNQETNEAFWKFIESEKLI